MKARRRSRGALGGLLGKLIEVLRPASAREPQVFVRAPGCRCGPGFCADSKGIGYMGSCSEGDGERTAAPDCTRCGAPHQSTLGCWCCQTRGADMTQPQDPEDRAGTEFWLRCLREGVRYEEVVDVQDAAMRAGGVAALPTADEALETVLARRKPARSAP